jgi:hypothetical protein
MSCLSIIFASHWYHCKSCRNTEGAAGDAAAPGDYSEFGEVFGLDGVVSNVRGKHGSTPNPTASKVFTMLPKHLNKQINQQTKQPAGRARAASSNAVDLPNYENVTKTQSCPICKSSPLRSCTCNASNGSRPTSGVGVNYENTKQAPSMVLILPLSSLPPLPEQLSVYHCALLPHSRPLRPSHRHDVRFWNKYL